jgi:aminomethyltransferase
LCLYGHDLDGSINPIEAGLAWTMGGPKSRRRTEGGFLGADRILKSDGGLMKVDRKRVGIIGMKAPAREGAEIYDAVGDRLIGKVTSGTFSPCLKGESDPVHTFTNMMHHRRPFAESRISAH